MIVFKILQKKMKTNCFCFGWIKKKKASSLFFLDFERVTSIVDEARDLLGHNSSFLDGSARPAHAIDRRSSHNLQTQGKQKTSSKQERI